ncbi:NupC/NupG family nucleoside CNT transporter [Ferrimonas balearica]|uniref:NupC/NupG family nucleoside CNT transporter n=1 Tax=Ferrimonas balearica TaxID=44012 RepID=UPI001C9829E6|nr:nucleoside transporter C-terminal domain-containing protein [Ferrimonas balearica]MBY5980886.1 NupC/NupG family nucleoside CNT transporter [Ferrimonas balearica]
MEVFISLLGMATLIGIALLFSENRRAVSVRTVAGALAFQIAFGAFVMFVPAGQSVLQAASNGVNNVIGYANAGLSFLMGDLANFKVGFIFLLHVLGPLVFVCALISVLYYLGLMQKIIGGIGGVLRAILGTSRAESLSATANIFVGPIEAPSLVRPFVNRMTRSELFAVMTGGLASVAGGTMIGYISLGIDPKYILTACFMTAPAGLLFAKLMCPETEKAEEDLNKVIDEVEDKPANVLDAAAAGASMGMQQVIQVGALLLAFVALIALINGMLSGIAAFFGYGNADLQAAFDALQATAANLPAFDGFAVALAQATEQNVADIGQWITAIDRSVLVESLSSLNLGDNHAAAVQAVMTAAEAKLQLQSILGVLLAPLAWVMGVPWSEAQVAASFIGQKLAINEFVAYVDFMSVADTLSPKTQIIVTFALCGFANFGSLAMVIGGLVAMAPQRRQVLGQIGPRCLLAAALANLMSGTIAGLLFTFQ